MSKLKKRFIKEVAKAEDILMQAQLDSEGYFSTEVNIMMYSIAELTGAIKDLMIKENQE